MPHICSGTFPCGAINSVNKGFSAYLVLSASFQKTSLVTYYFKTFYQFCISTSYTLLAEQGTGDFKHLATHNDYNLVSYLVYFLLLLIRLNSLRLLVVHHFLRLTHFHCQEKIIKSLN